MSAPNIVNVTSIVGKNAIQQNGGDVLTNPANSNKVFKINLISVFNGHTSTQSVILKINSVTVIDESITNATSEEVLTNPMYLTEGQTLNVSHTSNNANCVCLVSYEEIS